MFRITFSILYCFLLASFLSCYSFAQSVSSEKIEFLRDSLDNINLNIPPFPHFERMKSFYVKTQDDWDNLEDLLHSCLKSGERNIEIRVTGKNIVFGQERKVIVNWNYPDANIRIVGNKAQMHPYGFTFKRCDRGANLDNGYYSLPYTEFDINDIVIDKKGKEISLREETKQVSGDIEKGSGNKDDVWRFKIDLPDISEEQCKDFYVLMTRDWTSARHKVVSVQGGWLYFHLDSEDLHDDRNPNVDWTKYKVRPRYTLINNPVSKGLHFVDGRIYIPKQYQQVRVNKGGQLITFAYCHFNSLDITGFKLNGCGNGTPFGVYSSTFENGAYIHDNCFSNMSSLAVSTAFNKNVVIANNTITNTRVAAISGSGCNTTISGNVLRNIGWMLNTRAIAGGGENLHICDNIIEDFNYSAITCGSRASNDNAEVLTYIIERNKIKLSRQFTNNYIVNTLADGGGIYIGPQCTWGIIRNNVVVNIKGIHSNRGIFLDDGSKNLSIYKNVILNTANSYDIDLRLSNTLASDIPDYNTNNRVFYNVMSGGYRFEDNGSESNCYGGQNVLLGTGEVQKIVLDVSNISRDFDKEGIQVLREKGVIDKHVKTIIYK